jgi:uncharacterized protein (TIRG00374 family)
VNVDSQARREKRNPRTVLRRIPSTRHILVAAGVVISVGSGYFAVRSARPHATFEAIRESSSLWLVPALALLAIAFFARVERWRSLFHPRRRPPFGAATKALFLGYVANALLPVRAGEAVRTYALNRYAATSIAETAGTVILERAADVLSLLVLLFVMAPWLPHVSWLRAAGVVAVVLVAGLVVSVIVLARFGERPVRFLFKPLARVLPSEVVAAAPTRFVQGLVGLASPRVAFVAFAWTTASWVILGMGFWLVMLAAGLKLSPLAGVLVVVGIGLAMILPSSPAALGVFEGATVVVLSAYGVNGSDALSYALVLHALNVVPLLLIALVGAVSRRRLRLTAISSG